MQRFIALIVGVVFIATAAFIYIRNQNLIKNCTEEVTAIVVDMESEFSSDNNGADYMYYPVVEYKVGDDTIRATMDKGSSMPAYDINEEITIKYNPNKVSEFIVKGDSTSSIFSIVFGVLGLLVTGYGIKVAIKGY